MQANRLECADYPLYSQTAEASGAEAIIDPPSPTNRLGNWYAKLVFVKRVSLIIYISERSLLPVIVEARDAPSFSPRFRDAARLVMRGIGAGEEAQVLTERWRVHYNTRRPHSSLGYRPPAPAAIAPPAVDNHEVTSLANDAG